MIRNVLHLLMILCLLFVMDHSFTNNAIHELLGLLLVLLFIIHNALNRYWYTAIGKGKMNFLRTLCTITNLLLMAMMLMVIATGVLISQTIFSAFSSNGNLLAHQLHAVCAHLLFILSAIHLGLHWGTLWKRLCHCLRIDCTNLNYIRINRIVSLLIIGYGIYASLKRQIGSKILLLHVFSDWGTQPSMGDLILDYSAIMGCYIAITYFLTRILQKAGL